MQAVYELLLAEVVTCDEFDDFRLSLSATLGAAAAPASMCEGSVGWPWSRDNNHQR